MHDTALEYGKRFFETYVEDSPQLTVVDIGALDFNGSLRSVAPPSCKYVGVDFEAGNGVDIVITDGSALPFQDGEVDVCVSSSCFEHDEFFWLSFLEVMRILKPSGLFYLNVPSNGRFHRYPVDCWRFYPDSGIALQNWGRRNNYATTLLESFVGQQKEDIWNDFIAVFAKDEAYVDQYPRRIQDGTRDYRNGRVLGREEFSRWTPIPQDQEPPPPTRDRLRRSIMKLFG